MRSISGTHLYNIAHSNSKTYKLKTPNGEIIEVTNLSKFCKENNLKYQSLIKGSLSQGYILANAKPKKKSAKKRYLYEIITPEGEEILETNLNDFCRKNGLIAQNLNAVANGKNNSHKGYQCSKLCEIKDEDLDELITLESLSSSERQYKGRYKVTFPNGEETIVNNLTGFCREHKLSDSSVFLYIKGRIANYKGYKFKKLKDKK